MLQEAQRTEAPRSTSVSISTAVWMVMCSEPVTRTPASGFDGGVLGADRHQAGHLLLGDGDLFAAPVGERDVGDFVVAVVWGRRSAAVLWPRGLLSWLENIGSYKDIVDGCYAETAPGGWQPETVEG